jgi:hypothetical protein
MSTAASANGGRRLLLLGAILALSTGAGADDPPAPVEAFHGRGVYYFTGGVTCPLAGVGTRAANASNRIALDDDRSTVTVDRARRRIAFRNAERYERSRIVGDVLFLGLGTTPEGEHAPFGVHLKVSKRGERMTASVHPHPTTRSPLAAAEFERFEVVLDDGSERRVVLTPEKAERAVREPDLAARLSSYFLQVEDRLAGKPIRPDEAGARLVDLSIGFGAPWLSLAVAHVELRSLDRANAPLVRRGAIAEMLTRGSWELRIAARTPILKSEFDRDLFLFGLDGVELLAPLKWRGLLPGEALVIGFDQGEGFVSLGGRRSAIPNPADVARAYLEFHLLGGLITRQIVTLPERLQPEVRSAASRRRVARSITRKTASRIAYDEAR